MPENIAPGTYKADLLMEDVQFGETKDGKLQMILLASVQELGRTLTVPVFLSAEAAPYSIPKLRAAGWTGNDFTDLTGLGSKSVLLQVRYELYKGEEQMKVDLAGGAAFAPAKPMSQAEFAAKVKAVTAGMTKPPAGSGGAPPPF